MNQVSYDAKGNLRFYSQYFVELCNNTAVKPKSFYAHALLQSIIFGRQIEIESEMKAKNHPFRNSSDRKFFVFAVTIIIALLFSCFCFMAIASAQDDAQTPTTALTPTPPTTISSGAAIAAAIVVFIAFGLLIGIGFLADRNLNKGEMRRAIAGTFVVGFTMLMILSLHYGFYQNEIITAYIEFVSIVVGFYFGQRAAETKKENGKTGSRNKTGEGGQNN